MIIAYMQEFPSFYNVKQDYENLDSEVTYVTACNVCFIFFIMALCNVNISIQLYWTFKNKQKAFFRFKKKS